MNVRHTYRFVNADRATTEKSLRIKTKINSTIGIKTKIMSLIPNEIIV